MRTCWLSVPRRSKWPVEDFSFRCFLFLQHRRLLYDLFAKNYRVRRSTIQTRLAQELGDPTKAELDRLLHVRLEAEAPPPLVRLSAVDLSCSLSFQECCVSYAGMWYLKGTLPSWPPASLLFRSLTDNQIFSHVSEGGRGQAGHQSRPQQPVQVWGPVTRCCSQEAFLTQTVNPRKQELLKLESLKKNWT